MFSMGSNFLNSPGAQILGALGVHLPGAQPAAAPDPAQQGTPQQVTPQTFAGANFAAPQPPVAYQPVDLQPIPQPPHGGLFHRIASAMLGGG